MVTHSILCLFMLTTVHVLPGTSDVTFRTGEYKFGQCHVEGQYPLDYESFNPLDMTRTHPLGSSWTERCRNCSCNAFGVYCTGPQCERSYDFTQENWCLQWSEDGCCCEELGCIVDGESYALGTLYPFDGDNPCLMCVCEIGGSRDNCLHQQCGIYEIHCENRQVTYDDNCCPYYTCPSGTSCTEIPDPFPLTPHHELANWYGGQMEPIPIGTTQHFHIDTWNTYVCRCTHPVTANCSMESYTNTGW